MAAAVHNAHTGHAANIECLRPLHCAILGRLERILRLVLRLTGQYVVAWSMTTR